MPEKNNSEMEIYRYLFKVEEVLAVLPESERNELIEELKSHIDALLEEDPYTDLVKVLGDAKTYGSQLLETLNSDEKLRTVNQSSIIQTTSQVKQKHSLAYNVAKGVLIAFAVITIINIIFFFIARQAINDQFVEKIDNSQLLEMPDVRGNRLDEAYAKLREAGIPICQEVESTSPLINQWIKIQSPAPHMMTNPISECARFVTYANY